MRQLLITYLLLYGFCSVAAQHQIHIPFAHDPLIDTSMLSEKMVAGIHQYLWLEMQKIRDQRIKSWTEASHRSDFEEFINHKRQFLLDQLGIRGSREETNLKVISHLDAQHKVTQKKVHVQNIQWRVKDGIIGQGIMIRPITPVVASAIILPDADVTPEGLAGIQTHPQPWSGLAYQLAQQGWTVVVPALINRDTVYSGSELLDKWTNQPHREWLHKQGYELGRHLIGDELEKVFSLVDHFSKKDRKEKLPIVVMGHGEGGLLAAFAGALDTRISATLVSGYFNAWEKTYREPLYRNISGILREIGVAELAMMHTAKTLVVEHSIFPKVTNPYHRSPWQTAASPGIIDTPPFDEVEREFQQMLSYLRDPEKQPALVNAFSTNEGKPFSPKAIGEITTALDISKPEINMIAGVPHLIEQRLDRQKHLVKNLENVYQAEIARCEEIRKEHFWLPMERSVGNESKSLRSTFRKELWSTLGHLPDPSSTAKPQARILEESNTWTRYEVKLQVFSHVFAWGFLTIPNDMQPGEKLPVVVCQHGLEGLPNDVVVTNPNHPKFKTYQGFATKLADQGFITFAPHNPYRGGDSFRVLQRMANPLGFSLFSVIIAQHQRILGWLKDLPFVDPSRIGFYGLSYGGKTAMRIPAVLDGYALSVCSGDFNEWIRKNTSTSLPYSYMFYGEYEMPEWNLGRTFNYAEMACIIAPRPFMIEFGYFDGIGSVDWVNYEFGKVRRHYALNGWHDRIDKEFFAGPHRIHGMGTFDFLKIHLQPHRR